MKQRILFLLFFGVSLHLLAQSDEPLVGGTKWGIKLGPSVGLDGSSSPLLRYHGVAFIEGGGSEDNALYAAAGYHARGFARRFTYSTSQNPTQGIRTVSVPVIFHNVSMSLGVKKKKSYKEESKYYYSFAMRGELTAKTNLPHLDLTNPQNNTNIGLNSYYSNYARLFNWGIDIGAGIEKPLTQLITGFVEFTLSPDFSYQYRFTNLNPSGGFGSTSGHRNLSLELSLGFRFWNKVIYE